MRKTQMTEPLVLPKPKTKPEPKRETPKPKPKENDPWTVPAPKVNPTPKAIILKTKVMSVMKFKNGKMLIKTESDLNFVKSVTSKKAFNEKYTICPKLVSRILAKDAMYTAAFMDVSPLYNHDGTYSKKVKLN